MARFEVAPQELEGVASTLAGVEGSLGCPSRALAELGSPELQGAAAALYEAADRVALARARRSPEPPRTPPPRPPPTPAPTPGPCPPGAIAMPEAIAGIALPEGRQGAADEVAATLTSASGGFERTAATVQRAVTSVPSWRGLASTNFQDRCGSYEEAARAAELGCDRAAAAVRRYGADFEEAYARIQRLQREAEDCLERMKVAERKAKDAAGREQAARDRAASAVLSSPLDGGFSLGEQAAAQREADDAAAERRGAEAEAEREREELERLQREAASEHERIREAGRQAAGTVQAAQGELPAVRFPPPPAPAKENGGNVGDFLAGGIKEFSFGLVDLGGDKDSRWYKRGEIASYVPWNPASAVRSAGAGALKLGGRKAAKEIAEEGAQRAGRSVADDAAAFRGTATSDTRELTKNTEAYLGVEKPPGSVTHHLVPKGEYANRKAKEQLHEAQATLKRLGIGPDHGANGAFLDARTHGPIHTDKYFEALNDRLSRARTNEEALDILARIRSQVENGRFPR